MNAIYIYSILTIVLKNNVPQKTFYQMNNGAIWTPYRKTQLRIINFKQFS